MARGIAESDVHAAADALVAAGERPTVERIRAHLGTGSPNTVTRWLETWWQRLGGRLAAQQIKVALPSAPEHVAVLATQWWEQALVAAHAHAEQAVAAERGQLDAARADLALHEQGWQAQVHQHAAVAEQARQLLATAEQRLADVQRTCDAQTEQLRDLAAQRDAASLRAERLDAELGMAQRRGQEREAAWAAERELQSQHLRALENRAHAEVDRARLETKSVRAELAAQAKRHTAEVQVWRDREEIGRRALTQAQQEVAVQRARADTLEGQLQRAVIASKPATPRAAHGRRKPSTRKRTSTP